MRVAAVGRAFPSHYYDQDELLAAAQRHWGARLHNPDRLQQFFHNVLVGGRHLALPLERYTELQSWGEANDAWIEVAETIGDEAVREAMERAGARLAELRALYFVSVTGVATPSIDARLMNRLNLPADVKRVPIFGLGCVAGAAGVARVADYLRAFPGDVAVLLSVELCSLTLQRHDFSIPNLISSGLFGDGAAAVVMVGEERQAKGPRVVATRSVFYPDSERVMGWDISERGFQIVLSAEVPEVVRRYLRDDVDGFLADHGLRRADIGSWVAHPGGPKVLEAMQEALELPDGALERTWRSLREIGNLSSASVLMVLGDTLEEGRPEAGTMGMMLAMGPGFCSELVLLEW
jgi:alkylresorcinol/alkylpyrone synthase